MIGQNSENKIPLVGVLRHRISDKQISKNAGDPYYLFNSRMFADARCNAEADQESMLKQIKKAYYNCMKSCHPDLSGNDPDMTNFCMFINEVYYMVQS